jgi:hypothetical protein
LTSNPLITHTNVGEWGKNINKSSEMMQNALFFFFTTSEVNCLRLVSDLKMGKWGKNISEQAANSYREISMQ